MRKNLQTNNVRAVQWVSSRYYGHTCTGHAIRNGGGDLQGEALVPFQTDRQTDSSPPLCPHKPNKTSKMDISVKVRVWNREIHSAECLLSCMTLDLGGLLVRHACLYWKGKTHCLCDRCSRHQSEGRTRLPIPMAAHRQHSQRTTGAWSTWNRPEQRHGWLFPSNRTCRSPAPPAC